MGLVLPVANITPGRVVCYASYEDYYSSKKEEKDSLKTKKQIEYSGNVSIAAKSRIRKMMDSWVGAIENQIRSRGQEQLRKTDYITFVTLTLCSQQKHSDKEIKRKMFTPFLEDLKSIYKVGCYIWKAEKQKNGNIHFHIVINKRVHWLQIRNTWNKYLRLYKYVDSYREKMLSTSLDEYLRQRRAYKFFDETKAIEAFYRGQDEGWNNPNSTDIHAIEKQKNLCDYLVKYMAKNSAELKVQGRVWGCSDNLKQMIGLSVEVCHCVDTFIMNLYKNDKIKKIKMDYCVVIIAPMSVILKAMPDEIRKYMDSYLLAVFRTIYESKEFNHLLLATRENTMVLMNSASVVAASSMPVAQLPKFDQLSFF